MNVHGTAGQQVPHLKRSAAACNQLPADYAGLTGLWLRTCTQAFEKQC